MDSDQITDRIKSRFPDVDIDQSERPDDLCLKAALETFPDLMRLLHDDPELSYHCLLDIVGVDRLPGKPRFELVYVLVCLSDYRRLIVKLNVDPDQQVPSVTGIWQAADWAEREIYDLLGIRFSGHPDLRRILTWDNFEGHPLRKDFPLRGRDFEKTFDPDSIVVM